MPANLEAYHALMQEISDKVILVAVSKTKPVEDINELYEAGHRDFGENYVQELVAKQPILSADIRWHFIGHLQSNKVKYIAPFVHLIHGVDSLKLLQEINKQGVKNSRKINVLLQLHIATEETKFGFDETELIAAMTQLKTQEEWDHVQVCGIMAMASFSSNADQVRAEFNHAYRVYQNLKQQFFSDDPAFDVLSMGMSGDYRVAITEGSTMIRIGSMLFGERNKVGA
ncbi:MAG: YggS family pyridoxal phosphate-dependent enzyme [Sphingobacteriales bacterium]|jgi:pyridoxal phosphate enzyme (YggS family)